MYSMSSVPIIINRIIEICIYLNKLIQQNLILKNQLAILKSEIHNGTNQKVDF